MSDPAQAWQWRLLRRLLPREYADHYGAALLQVHLDRANERGGRRGAGLWLRIAWDVGLTAIQLQSDNLSDSSTLRFTKGAPMRLHLSHAARGLARAPGFTLTVVLTLGLGIGATLTLYTILDRLLFSPPAHVRNADDVRRISVHGVSPFTHALGYSRALSYPDYVDLAAVRGFRQIAAHSARGITIGSGANSEKIYAELASASYFPLLGVVPARGRFYTEAEDQIAGGAPVAVLGHGFWRSYFGGADDAIGREIRVGKGSYTIIGVAPQGFTGVDLRGIDIWLPLLSAQAIESGTDWRDARRWYWFGAIARVSPGVADAAAADEATVRYRAGRSAVQNEDPNARIHLSSLIAARGPEPSHESRVARALTGLALLVLLIACANVANLLLTRGIQQRRSLAIRQAMGESRGALMRQLLMEALLLASAAGLIAIVFTHRSAPLLFRTLLPDAMLPMTGVLRLAAVTSAVAMVVTLMIGLLPSLRSTRFDVLEALRTARAGRRGSALRRGLMFVQATLCAVLLVGAGMFLQSLQRARTADLGVDLETLAINFELEDGTRGGEGVSRAAYAALERIRALPFVDHAAVTTLPQFMGNLGITVRTARDSIVNGGRGPFFYSATGEYFEALGLRLLAGRTLTDADDRPGAPVAVISQSLARLAFPERNAVGGCLYLEENPATGTCTTVVGVVEDAMPSIRASEPNFNLYIPPNHISGEGVASGTVVVKTRGSAESYVSELQRVARGAMPGIRFVQVSPLSEFLARELQPWRLGAVLLTAFGLLALMVAAAGLYSLLSFDAAQRRFELGVRAAVGANARQLVAALAAKSLAIAAAGIASGLLLGVLVTRAASTLLFRISPTEPLVYATVAVTLMLVAAGAAILPATRAARVDPRVALQE